MIHKKNATECTQQECHCFPSTTTDYCGRVSILGTLKNCVNRLHDDLVHFNENVNMYFEKKTGFFRSSDSHMTAQILLQLKQTIDFSQSQINDMLTELKTQSLCVHTCGCQSSCHTEDNARIEKADSEAEKLSLALEQVSSLCQMKTSIITNLQEQLQVYQKIYFTVMCIVCLGK